MSRELPPQVSSGDPHAAGAEAPPPAPAKPAVGIASPGRWRWAWVPGLFVVLVAVTGLAVRSAFTHDAEEDGPKQPVGALTVETAMPAQRNLVRTVEQAGTIEPSAQAELYAKASGYLLSIRREITPAVAAALVGRLWLASSPPGVPAVGQATCFAAGAATTLYQAPQIDIGSWVEAGDVLLEIDVPERRQDVAEKEAALDQRQEELTQARTAIDSVKAEVTVARARLVEAEAEVERHQSAYELRGKQLARIRELVRQKALERQLEDEKAAEAAAAKSAWGSSVARVNAARAEVELAQAKLTTAQGAIRVSEAKVRGAVSDLERARVLLEYGMVRAPFRGMVTHREVDEGDFVQNARTGNSKPLMTVTASETVKAVVRMPSREAVHLRPGARVTVTADTRPGEAFVGRVARTSGLLDEESRTLRTEIDLDNHGGRLMPGMYVHVRLSLSESPNTWVVPATALYSRNKVNYVIVVRDGVAHRQPVRIAFDGGGEVEVLKVLDGKELPLTGTEELVISGKGAIADGQRVRPVRQAAAVARNGRSR